MYVILLLLGHCLLTALDFLSQNTFLGLVQAEKLVSSQLNIDFGLFKTPSEVNISLSVVKNSVSV